MEETRLNSCHNALSLIFENNLRVKFSNLKPEICRLATAIGVSYVYTQDIAFCKL